MIRWAMRPGRTAVVAGATGLVGKCLISELLALPQYARVLALTRRPLPFSDPRLESVIVDYDRLEEAGAALAADEAFCCLGTTIKAAGSRAAFERVDLGYVESFAKLAARRGAKKFLLVSSSGADARSPIFYSRVKGLAEQAAAAVPFESVDIFRPSLLLGPRADNRPVERLGQLVLEPLSFLFIGPLRPYRPIKASVVARAMTRAAAQSRKGARVFESPEIALLGKT